MPSDPSHLLAAALVGAGALHACTLAREAASSGVSARSPAVAVAPVSPTGGGTGKVVGLLHPGAMGASIGFNAKLNGAQVLWASEGRSPETAARAAVQEFEDARTLESLVERSGVIVSVCPPAAALALAQSVAQLQFSGTYVDANAVAPATATKIAEIIRAGGGKFVDGGIVGGPAWKSGPQGPSTRMYLSGAGAATVAALFEGTHLGAPVVHGPSGQEIETGASAMKIAYASWTKGSSALLLNSNAFALACGVHETLAKEWVMSVPAALEKSQGGQGIGPKAWRWVGEMNEISQAYQDVGLSGDFHSGAATVYEGLAHLKGSAPDKSLVQMAHELKTKAACIMGIRWGVKVGADEADF
jgi:3-hydroxyisobutyrate dehydrogenase-like beta-hydroxyacid dehydrogenase